MVFSFERPRARVSDSFYRPECRFIEKSFRKTFKEATPIKDSSVFERISRRRDVRSQMRSVEQTVATTQRFRSASMPPPSTTSSTAATTVKAVAKEVEEAAYTPIWKKHPYKLAVEDLHVPPAEDSVWPSNRPHFHLVSSYDLMLKYLGLETLRPPLPGTGGYLVRS